VRASIASSHRVLYRRSAFDDALFTRWALAERGEHARRRGLEP
jgi:hypothetical protein